MNGFITNFIVITANVDDRATVFELVEANNTLKILGDKGYISKELKSSLAKKKQVLLISLKRKNSKHPLEKQFRNILSKARRRIETSFSQLAEQFNINRVLAKSKWGLMLRIALKVLAHNLSFILNIITGNVWYIGSSTMRFFIYSLY